LDLASEEYAQQQLIDEPGACQHAEAQGAQNTS